MHRGRARRIHWRSVLKQLGGTASSSTSSSPPDDTVLRSSRPRTLEYLRSVYTFRIR